MPTYDYSCTACGHRFEEFQSMTAPALTECPACHAVALKRIIGAGAGMIFKGSGFYLTDYRPKGSEAGSSSTDDTVRTSEPSAKPPASQKGSTQ